MSPLISPALGPGHLNTWFCDYQDPLDPTPSWWRDHLRDPGPRGGWLINVFLSPRNNVVNQWAIVISAPELAGHEWCRWPLNVLNQARPGRGYWHSHSWTTELSPRSERSNDFYSDQTPSGPRPRPLVQYVKAVSLCNQWLHLMINGRVLAVV